MDVRRLILRLSLGSLAITAASAMTLLIFPWTGFAGRFTLSALAATFSAALALPFGAWAVRPESRWGGLAGIAFVSAELILVIASLWAPIIAPSLNDFELASAMLYILAAAPFGILGARELNRRPLVGGVVVVATLIAIAMLLTQAFVYRGLDGLDNAKDPLGPLGFTMLLLGGGLALGLVEARLPMSASPLMRRWPLIGGILAVAGAIASTYFFMLIGPGFAGLPKTFDSLLAAATLGAFAYAIGFANVVLLPRLRGASALVQTGTAVAAFGVATTISCWIWTNDDSWATPLVASLILVVSGSLGVVILKRFFAEPTFVKDLGVIDQIDLTCPRCRRKQHVPIGPSSCTACGLRFSIDVEEPRCRQCDHLLFGTASDRCPECGTLIVGNAESKRPASA